MNEGQPKGLGKFFHRHEPPLPEPTVNTYPFPETGAQPDWFLATEDLEGFRRVSHALTKNGLWTTEMFETHERILASQIRYAQQRHQIMLQEQEWKRQHEEMSLQKQQQRREEQEAFETKQREQQTIDDKEYLAEHTLLHADHSSVSKSGWMIRYPTIAQGFDLVEDLTKVPIATVSGGDIVIPKKGDDNRTANQNTGIRLDIWGDRIRANINITAGYSDNMDEWLLETNFDTHAELGSTQLPQGATKDIRVVEFLKRGEETAVYLFSIVKVGNKENPSFQLTHMKYEEAPHN